MNSVALIKQERQDDLSRAIHTIAKRVEKCIAVGGGIFEHLLWTVAIYWDHLHNQWMQSVHLPFLHTFCKAFYAYNSNSCISTPIENWTHVCMNLFTRNSPYYHLLKYLLFLLKHPVYTHLSPTLTTIFLCPSPAQQPKYFLKYKKYWGGGIRAPKLRLWLFLPH